MSHPGRRGSGVEPHATRSTRGSSSASPGTGAHSQAGEQARLWIFSSLMVFVQPYPISKKIKLTHRVEGSTPL